MKHINPRLNKALTYGGVIAVLMAVFTLYTRPDFLVALSNQIWACF
jgi:hypothetical protein